MDLDVGEAVATLHAADRTGLDFPTKEALRKAVHSGAVRHVYRVRPYGLQGPVDVADVTVAGVIIGPTFYARPQWIAQLNDGAHDVAAQERCSSQHREIRAFARHDVAQVAFHPPRVGRLDGYAR
ncbi:MAG: hypothetical protein ACSLE6_03085 [Mycobacterium sp.]